MAYSQQDFIAGFDPTGQIVITAAQLLALIQSGTPFSDKGLLLTTTDVASVPEVPDANTYTKLQRYIWRRIAGTTTIAYLWDPTAAVDVTFLKWKAMNVVNIPPEGITNAMLAPGSVTDDKIASVSYGKISGIPGGLPPSGAASGDLTGTYPAPTIAANAVTGAKLSSSASDDTLRAVSNDHIKSQTISPAGKLSVSGLVASMILRVNALGTAWEAVTKLITQLAEPVVGDADKIVKVNSAGTGFELATPQNAGFKVLQIRSKASTAGDSTTNVIPFDNTIPQQGGSEGKEYISHTITTISATSLIRVRFGAYLAGSGNVAQILALFKDATADAVAATGSNSTVDPKFAALDYIMASPGAGTLITFKVRFGPESASTGYINTTSGGKNFGGVNVSYLTIEEVVGSLV